MSYTILVFVKQVPDTKNVTGEAMKPDGTVNRAALPAIFNPEDLNALELALELKDRYQAKVVVATMGLPAASAVLRDSLCRGADEAILLTDRAFAGADTLATSFSLSRLAKRLTGVISGSSSTVRALPELLTPSGKRSAISGIASVALPSRSNNPREPDFFSVFPFFVIS